MIFSIITIILSILSFNTNPWFCVATILTIILAIAEYIAEVIFAGGILEIPPLLFTAIALFVVALLLMIISLCVSMPLITGDGGGTLLVKGMFL